MFQIWLYLGDLKQNKIREKNVKTKNTQKTY